MSHSSIPRRLWWFPGLIVMMIGGCSQAPRESSQASAARFLEQLRAGQVDAAWDAASTEFKSLMGRESLRDLVKRRPALKEVAEFVDSRTMEQNGRAMEECTFQSTTKVRGKPQTFRISVLLAADDSAWKVEQIAVE